MAHRKNTEFHLYTGFTPNGNECYAAYEHLVATGLLFRHLHYGDPIQHPEVIASLNTWWDSLPKAIEFPFVTYTEMYDFTDPQSSIPKIIIGIDDIRTTDWVALESFQG